jgi:GDP-L-fucose synthase
MGPVYVAGHRGLVGSALVRALRTSAINPVVRTRSELDLRDPAAVDAFFADIRPAVVFLAAAKVGGIGANAAQPWDFLYDNLLIQNSVLGSAMKYGTDRVIFFGSSCIYPKLAPQPIREEYLLTGPLEPTNEAYAIAKISGLKMVEAANTQYGHKWVSLMPTNLYGPGDNFDLAGSHVLPAMIRKFHEAKLARERGEDVSVTLWGTGTVRREFLYVDDLAQAALRVMSSDETGLFNVGFGSDVTVSELAEAVARAVGYSGPIIWDVAKPDGTPRKLLDSSRIRTTGWAPTVKLDDGISAVYDTFVTGERRG